MLRVLMTLFAALVWIGAVIGLIAARPLGELTFLLALPTSAVITLCWVWSLAHLDHPDRPLFKES